MCTDLKKLRNGVQVWCGKCAQCRITRKNDLVGRCCAEMYAHRAKGLQAHFLTVTYCPKNDFRIPDTRSEKERRKLYQRETNPHAVDFYYGDFQRYLKTLRNYSDGLRYVVAGELGEEKGRVHWHAIIFWKGDPVPNIDTTVKRYNHWIQTPEQAKALNKADGGRRSTKGIVAWRHGFSEWRVLNRYGAIDYVMKYMMKQDNTYQGRSLEGPFKKSGRSNLPPLGHEWFCDLARRQAEAGLPPNDYYDFPDVIDTRPGPRKGHRRKFLLPKGAMRTQYLDAYLKAHASKWGDRDFPDSPGKMLQRHLDEKTGHFSRYMSGIEFDDYFRVCRKERTGNGLLALLRTRVKFHRYDATNKRFVPRRIDVEEIGNDLERYDAQGHLLTDEHGRPRHRRKGDLSSFDAGGNQVTDKKGRHISRAGIDIEPDGGRLQDSFEAVRKRSG